VGAKQQKVEKPTKSSKSAHVGFVWTQANAKFKFGEPMLSKTELEKAGPGCVALHAHYMKECEEHRKSGMIVVIKRQHFWCDVES
jgi:Cu/Zn superoxide dismutase